VKAALPVLWLAVLASCGRRDQEARIEAATRAALQHERAGRIDDAIAEYRKALAATGESTRWKTQSADLRAHLKLLEEEKEQVAAATAEFEKFRAQAARVDDAGAAGLLREGRELHARVRDSKLPWLPELASILEKLQARAEKK
jgi:hypothetical protein